MMKSTRRRWHWVVVALGVLLVSTGAAREWSAGPAAGGVAALETDRANAHASEHSAPGQEPAATADGTAVGSDRGDAAPAGALGETADGGEVPTEARSARQEPGVLGLGARAEAETPWQARLISCFGLAVLLGIAWLLSVDRRVVPWRIVGWGLALQFAFALVILKTAPGEAVFNAVNDIVVAFLGFTVEGARFIFGNLVWNNVPVGAGQAVTNFPISAQPGMVAETGASFAFSVLPTIIFFSSLMTVLYYLGVMQAVVKGVAWVMMRTLRTSGAETLSAAGNIFVGQTEAPLLIKPFVAKMTMSELMVVMTAGFATVAGGVMAAYVGMLVAYFPGIAGHLLAASVMSAPAAVVIAKVMYPEKEDPVTAGRLAIAVDNPDANVIDAAARGAGEGLTLALNVGAMLLAFIALIALLNALLGWFGAATHLTAVFQGWGWLAEGQTLTLESVLGWILAPLAWLMGVPWKDAAVVGSLLGVKTVLNEFVAYLQLSDLLSSARGLSPRSVVIATYALAGFANFSSIAIQVGGIGGIAPSRRSDLSRLGLRAMIGGTLAAFMTATVAGILL